MGISENILIQQAKISDLDEIVNVHLQCFPKSFSTTLGKLGGGGLLLKNYYCQYMETSPELFLVALKNEKIIGFCMGYYCENTKIKKLWLRKNILRLFWAACLLCIRCDKNFFSRIVPFRKRETVEFIDDKINKGLKLEDKLDLLSICVLEEFRGTTIAKNLIKKYEDIGKLHRRKACVLSAKRDNFRAIKFYEKRGYQVTRRSESGLYFIKIL